MKEPYVQSERLKLSIEIELEGGIKIVKKKSLNETVNGLCCVLF